MGVLRRRAGRRTAQAHDAAGGWGLSRGGDRVGSSAQAQDAARGPEGAVGQDGCAGAGTARFVGAGPRRGRRATGVSGAAAQRAGGPGESDGRRQPSRTSLGAGRPRRGRLPPGRLFSAVRAAAGPGGEGARLCWPGGGGSGVTAGRPPEAGPAPSEPHGGRVPPFPSRWAEAAPRCSARGEL